ncbi:MAG: hypothetical protein C4K49_03600 [Candidatus Thorarchaeota archaeon]|nr:MAG: hypothetical protein C4K49_03600 [Candidatus Thorarchaeota archaeon]
MSSVVIVVIIFGSVGALLFITNPYEPPTIAVVVMDPGFGDLSLADQTNIGMQNLTHDVSVEYFVPTPYPQTVSEAEALLRNLAAQGKYDLIVAIGSKLVPALQNAAEAYPGQKFAMVGGYVDLANVASASFAVEQASFLAGVLAAFLSAQENYTSKVGVIASVEDDPMVTSLVSGFVQGVQHANSTYLLNVSVLPTQYIGSYNDTDAAQLRTYNMFILNQASVIFAPVRASIKGVRLGMLQANSSLYIVHRMPLVIGAEADQDYYGCADISHPTDPSWISTSAVPRADMAIYQIANLTLWDLFPGNQNLQYNLANGGANVTAFQYSTTYISHAILTIISDYKDSIVEGTIVVTP